MPAEDPVQGSASHGLKRARSVSSDDDSTDSDEDEAVTLSDVLQVLDRKYPKLNLPQYMPLFEAEKIMYAETFLQCNRAYLTRLGVAEGAIHLLMEGVPKVLSRETRERKRIRAYGRNPSVEI